MATTNTRDRETRNNEPTLNRRLTAGGAASAGDGRDHHTPGNRPRPRLTARRRTRSITMLPRMDRRQNSWGLDKRTTRYRTAAAWRHEIIVALGGLDEVSMVQLLLVDLVIHTKMIMELLDRSAAELAAQEPILSKDRHIIGYLPVRQQLDKALDRDMRRLGLDASAGFFHARSGTRAGQRAQ